MIEPGSFLAFCAAVVILMLIPGPNVALIVANSVAYGSRYGLLTVAGTSSAMVVQLGLTAIGMTKLLGALGFWFEGLRWVGVAYLVYLGIAQWRAPVSDLSEAGPDRKAPRAIYGKAFLISLTNPKTLLFYGAFFPQFVTIDHSVGPQIAILSAMFLALAVFVDGGWALIAGRARYLLRSHGRLRNRLSGGFLFGAGAALALVRSK